MVDNIFAFVVVAGGWSLALREYVAGRRHVWVLFALGTLPCLAVLVLAASALPVILQETAGDQTTYHVYGLDLLSATDNSSVQTHFLYDGPGSTRQLTDGAGSVAATDAYNGDGLRASRTVDPGENGTGVGELP
jgi:hypothetical protein